MKLLYFWAFKVLTFKSCARHRFRDYRMTFIESIKTVYAKYGTFSGRATRSEYWWFVLFVFLMLFAFIALVAIAKVDLKGYLAITIFVIIFCLPMISLYVRRLHDIGKSGWWIFLGLVPYIGEFVLFIFSVMGSDGENEYGPDPFDED